MQFPVASTLMAPAHQHRAPVFLCFSFFFLACSPLFTAVFAQAPVFACNFLVDPSLASFGFCNVSLGIKDRVADLVGRLTLQEKILFLASNAGYVERLGISRYNWWSEALHGVSDWGTGTRFFSLLVPGATSFPQVILTAASFNTSLFEEIGKVVSTEARAMYNVGLAGLTFWSTNVNIFTDPRWGRGQETPGEDPLLSSTYGSSYVKGLQERDDGDPEKLKVAACCKYYTAYGLDNWNDTDWLHFNAVVTQQDMEDTFQPPFKSCVIDGNVASIQCSSNQVNGKPACADPDLLSGVIRSQWKLNGYIVSGCDSVKVFFESQNYTKTPEEAAAKAILAGVDLNCGYFLGSHTEDAVKAGLLNDSAIDNAISNTFTILMRLGFFDGDPRKHFYGNLTPFDVCTPKNQELAREAARQGIVLLKNSAGSLPLSPAAIKTLAVIGPNANATETMIGDFQGIPCNFTTPLQGLAASIATTYHPGCADVLCSSDTSNVDEAKQMAASAEATVLVMGVDQSIETMAHDRAKILLPGQQQFFIEQVADFAKGPVILVIMSGGGMDISFAKTNDKITSILWVGYPGEAGGAAIADVIFGYHNPSGRLPMTWYPQSFVDQVPMTNMNMRPDPVTGYPGRTYRFYTGEAVYSFGDGLSYSEFTHELLQAPEQLSVFLEQAVHACNSSDCNKSFDPTERTCRDLSFHVDLRVTNTGRMSGSHTVLLFSSPPAVHKAPKKQLVNFQKITLKAQMDEIVRFKVDVCKDMSLVDEFGSRKVALGEYLLHIGSLKRSLTVVVGTYFMI